MQSLGQIASQTLQCLQVRGLLTTVSSPSLIKTLLGQAITHFSQSKPLQSSLLISI